MIKLAAFGKADRKFRFFLSHMQDDQRPIDMTSWEGFGTKTCVVCGATISQIGSRRKFLCGNSTCENRRVYIARDESSALLAHLNLIFGIMATFGGPKIPQLPELRKRPRPDESDSDSHATKKKPEATPRKKNTKKGSRKRQDASSSSSSATPKKKPRRTTQRKLVLDALAVLTPFILVLCRYVFTCVLTGLFGPLFRVVAKKTKTMLEKNRFKTSSRPRKRTAETKGPKTPKTPKTPKPKNKPRKLVLDAVLTPRLRLSALGMLWGRSRLAAHSARPPGEKHPPHHHDRRPAPL